MESSNTNPASAIFQDIATQLPGEYELLEFVGEGGHGIVFKALFKPMQKIVALKILKYDPSDDMAKRVQRLQSEARILAKLDHPNIVKVFQMGYCKDNTPYIVCEYLEGITLEQFLKTNPNLSPRQLYELFTQVLDALDFSHKQGLVHRDVKPSNILLLSETAAGSLRVKVLDFGVARDLEKLKDQPMGLTRTIQISGSAPYMSPEQCLGDSVDIRSDIYSLACVLFECLSGRTPFRGDTPIHTRYMQIHENPQLPTDDSLASLPGRAGLYVLCLKALSKDREKRPQSAAEFKEEFLKIILPYSSAEVWNRRSKVHRALIPICIGSLLLAVLTGTLLLKAPPKSRSESHKVQVNENQGSAALSLKEIDKHASPLLRISRIQRQFEKILVGTTVETAPADYLSKVMKMREELCEIIQQPNNADRKSLYAAWLLRSDLESWMHMRNEAKNSILEALIYSRLGDGSDTIETLPVYSILAQSCMQESYEHEHRSTALKEGIAVAQKALALEEKIDSAPGRVPSLDLPPILQSNHSSSTEKDTPNFLLGMFARQESRYKDAIAYFKKSMDKADARSESGSELSRMLIAEILSQVGKKSEAKILLQDYIIWLEKDTTRTLITRDVSILQVGKTAYKLGMYDLAKRACADAEKLEKEVANPGIKDMLKSLQMQLKN